MVTDLRRVSAIEAHGLLRDEGYAYVDVRSEPELSLGVPEGAYHVPLFVQGSDSSQGLLPNEHFVDVMRACFPPDARLVIGCESGVRSLRAAQLLVDAGYVNVVDQRAGFSGVKDAFGRTVEAGWRAAGLPVAYELLAGHDYGALESQRKNAT